MDHRLVVLTSDSKLSQPSAPCHRGGLFGDVRPVKERYSRFGCFEDTFFAFEGTPREKTRFLGVPSFQNTSISHGASFFLRTASGLHKGVPFQQCVLHPRALTQTSRSSLSELGKPLKGNKNKRMRARCFSPWLKLLCLGVCTSPSCLRLVSLFKFQPTCHGASTPRRVGTPAGARQVALLHILPPGDCQGLANVDANCADTCPF